ncbi:MAG: cysteine desulfurase family protein [Acidimicrobiales bacterium]
MTSAAPIHYLDHAATTPVSAAAIDALCRTLVDEPANPSGAHRLARRANAVLDDARDAMADLLGARPSEVIFTSGGTEADNLAVAAALAEGQAAGRTGPPACSAIEHHAVLEPVEHAGGVTVPVDAAGVVDLDALAATIDERTPLVSVMAVNNEVGTIQPLDAIAEVVRREAPGAWFHVDAVQGFAWLDPSAWAAADLVSVSAHKFHGPKGTGALVARGGRPIRPLAVGGGQEQGRRGGTPNLAGIVAMSVAAAEAADDRANRNDRVWALRHRLADGLLAAVPDAVETVPRAATVPGIAHLCFDGAESEALLILLERGGVMASAAASCSSGAMEPSHVLSALGVERSRAFGSLRLSLSATSTDADVDAALAVVPDAVARARGERPAMEAN